jgi:hypothetical protein
LEGTELLVHLDKESEINFYNPMKQTTQGLAEINSYPSYPVKPLHIKLHFSRSGATTWAINTKNLYIIAKTTHV